jgi:site-specific DNA recombinase
MRLRVLRGKTTHQRGAGHCLKDFCYCRCSGTDGHRFGGERICSNPQIQGELLETAVWRKVCDLLTNPRKLEQQFQDGSGAATSLQDIENLRAQRRKLQHGLERVIDSFAEGLIDKEQLTPRMTRTKSRIAELDTKISADTGDADHQKRLRFLASRLHELAASVGPHIADADWERRREIIRSLIQRIEIGPKIVTIVFRLSLDCRGSGPESIVVTLSRV